MHVDLKLLDNNLQHFLQQYQQGHRDVADLVSAEMFRTRNHVTHESQKATVQIQLLVDKQSAELDKTIRKSNQQVSNEMAALSLDRDREAKRRRFLSSFKFPGMNERRNQVGESCEGTFQWIFADDMGMLEDPDNDSEWTDGESESSEGSSNSTDNSSDWTYDAEEQDNATYQDGGIRWDSFIDWLKSGSSIFWCSGKPGSGKSTLMRYIISDPRTKSALEVWSPDVHLISHFFWRPGSPMQQSMRGMFCSILYQLLARDAVLLDKSITACSLGGHRDSDTDWSATEIQNICLDTIEQYNRPICLFLDGLDEVSFDDGVVRLIETIHGLGTIPNVKVCVSSRPEYLIEKHLGHGRYPFIRLQDLTNQDLRTYAESHIKFPPKFKMWDSWGGLEDPIRVLVDKAEGVFLWLCLAIQSLNRGLDHQNNLDDLAQRVRNLPASLENLYKDMWTRLNDDQLLYRQKAALYLRLVIANQKSPKIGVFSHGLNVFVMMLIGTSMAYRVLEQHGNMIHPSILITECDRIQSEVLIRCAGLLELPESRSGSVQYEAIPWGGDQYDAVMPHITSRRHFQLIHRSAYDFLSDTPEGEEILSHCRFSNLELQRQIIFARVATCQLALVKRTKYLYVGNVCWNELDQIFSSIGTTILNPLGQSDYQRNDWMQLMKACERLCTSNRLLYFGGQPTNIFGHVSQTRFYTLAARHALMEIAFADAEYLELRPKILSELLFETCSYTSFPPWTLRCPDTQSSRLIAELLKHGANQDAKQISRGFPRMLETPLSLIVRGEMVSKVRNRETWLSYLHTLGCLSDHGANFQQSVLISLSLSPRSRKILLVDMSRNGSQPAWVIYIVLPASVVVASTIATYRALDLSLAQESEYLLSLLDSSCAIHRDSEARVVGLQKNGSLPSNIYGRLSPEDSDRLRESLNKYAPLGSPKLVARGILSRFEVEGLGKIFNDVLQRCEWTQNGVQEHLIDLGLREATIYVDNDGVQYSRDVAKGITPEWMAKWLYRIKQ